jgi:hypothetical protein
MYVKFIFLNESSITFDQSLSMNSLNQAFFPAPKRLTLWMLLTCFFTVISLGSLRNLVTQTKAQATQTEQAADPNLNKTQKSVFDELKKATSEDKNTVLSLIMIGAVLAVVGLAMYLAFRGGSSSRKTQFARTPKKQI